MIVCDHKDHLVTVTVMGEFTIGDYREFEALANEEFRFRAPVDLLFDLREMAAFTVDMAWEDIRFTRDHGRDFRRIAVLTRSQFVAWSAWLTQAFISAELKVFAEEAEARAWLVAA